MLWRRRIRYLNNCFFSSTCRHSITEQAKWYYGWSLPCNDVFRLCKYYIHSTGVANQFTKICWTSSILQVEIICLQGEGKLTSVERNSMTHCLCLKFGLEGIRLLTEQYLRFIAFILNKKFRRPFAQRRLVWYELQCFPASGKVHRGLLKCLCWEDKLNFCCCFFLFHE